MKMKSFWLFGASWWLLILACTSIGPKYIKPSVEVPSVYKEAAQWKPAQPKEAVKRGSWWDIFQDPQLNSLEEKVNLSNQNIAAAVARLDQARALIKGAKAQYAPTVGLNPNVTTQKGSLTGGSEPVSTNTITIYSVPLEATWVPDLWGRVRKTVEQNEALAQVSEADLENMRLVSQVDLATAYFQLRFQDELIRIFDESVKAYQESLRLTQALAKTGIDSDEAVAQAETQLRATEAQATNLRIARAQYEHAIALLIGRPASGFALNPEPFQSLPPEIPVSIPSDLLERRPDIASAERNMAAANARIGIAESAYFPQLSLDGRIGVGSSTWHDLIAAPVTIWSLGATLSETLFDGGARSATVAQSRALFDEAVATYRQTVLTAFQQVEDSLVALQVLSDQIQKQDLAVQSADRFLKIATARYRLGLDPYLNVLTAQISLLSNQQTAHNLRMQRMLACVRLIEALGGYWESRP